MGARHDAELVVASLNMAAATRGGDVKGVIFHSDRGSEYGSWRIRRTCRRLGVTQSMGRVGSCFDSAVSEAFNSVLKVEYVYRHTFATRTEARLRIATWITGFYNTHRLHSVQAFGGAVATIAGPLVMAASGISAQHSLWFSLAGFVAGLCAVVAGARLIDRVNRRTLGIWSCVGVFVAGLGIAFLGPKAPALLLAFFVLYSLLTWFGPGVLSWVWSSEAFPTHLRGIGSGVAQAVTRLMIAMNVVLAPHLLERFGLRSVALYASAYVLAAAVVALSPFLATTGKELEEINIGRE
ncbi:MFS transporter [Streptomyces sp. NBC_00237]|uniref:MFS transporter n=1 Tax=Streptomyces sp. NBC_00237 TaxID=2975687 RepID=UPI002256BF7A|nr:MFS transporter [Streptomyces sp. NBC_00237]MCX5205839.1 MFS transporter [Streptomyces sp. NBC_00237]